MKMTSIEKTFLDKIVADSGENISVVRNVLKAVLISMLKEIYAARGNSENKDFAKIKYHIPYICELDITCNNVLTPNAGEVTAVQIETVIETALYNEIQKIFSDQTTEIKKLFKQEICLTLLNILDFDKDTIIDVN